MSNSNQQHSDNYTCTAGLSSNAAFIVAKAAYDHWQAADDKNAKELEQCRQTLDQWHKTKQAMDDFLKRRGRLYSGCTFDNYAIENANQRKVVDALRAYARQSRDFIPSGKNVLLIGPKGTGKDHLLVALAKACFMESGYHPEWCNGVDVLDSFRREAMSSYPSSFGCSFVATNILYVSDLLPPTGTLSENEQRRLFRVIDSRYSDRKSTWLSLNVQDGAEAEQRMGSQTVDRLRHDALVLFCNWESYRRVGDAIR